MKKTLHFIVLFSAIFTFSTNSQIPPGYYNNITTQTCAQLKTALKNIISANTTVLTYTPGVLNSVQTTDMHRNDANTADVVWDMYSDNPTGPESYTYPFYTSRCGNYDSEGDCYNREHSFPQEWFGDNSLPMYTDIHHIFPTDGYVNGKKANYALGEVANPVYISTNGSKLGPNKFPGFTGTVFEPIDAYKGDLARAQLYMITRYEDSMVKWKNNGNANDVLNGTSYPSLDDWYIQLLYKWHTQDPVSQKEIDRNNAVYLLQGNRNPYIDHPEYVAALFTCSVVPVSLTDLSAEKDNESIVLTWHTSWEANFKNYEIERSIDGIHFEKIAVVVGQNLRLYSLTDKKLPATSAAFYRLNMVDINGHSNFSKVISVRLTKEPSVQVYPNPAKDFITLKTAKSFAKNTHISIIDVTGRILLQQTIIAVTENINLDIRQLPAGRYFLRISSSSALINESFLISGR